MKSGNLNFLESSGPLQACNGTALPLLSCSGCKIEYFSHHINWHLKGPMLKLMSMVGIHCTHELRPRCQIPFFRAVGFEMYTGNVCCLVDLARMNRMPSALFSPISRVLYFSIRGVFQRRLWREWKQQLFRLGEFGWDRGPWRSAVCWHCRISWLWKQGINQKLWELEH